MDRHQLFQEISRLGSYLCVGLDADIRKIPSHLKRAEDPIFEFNKAIIDATADYCVAYKPNIAFYEALGAKGWDSLQKTLNYIPADKFTIADAKRGDIGNTSSLYARAFFENLPFDSVTVAPYMGEDSVKPFMEFEGKWVILLALTSNAGSNDFQQIEGVSGVALFEEVMRKSMTWGNPDNLMFVVGATRGEMFKKIRQIAPEHFLLVPGVGAQGGDLKTVSEFGMNSKCGLLVNSSRGIIYASDGKDFAQAAAREAKAVKEEMEKYLSKYL
ncbi:orotidine-5'-phosphate decarboxylase [Cytophagaceae bacterium ABcell3]|nr:orotidine-5'-phosphate decarboxylase [Cytophagaceae bacterium ABcell3]